MGNWLLTFLLDKVAKSLDGYKTYIVGTVFILKGVLGLIGHYWPDIGVPGEDINRATDEIMLGIGWWSGRHAIAKIGKS